MTQCPMCLPTLNDYYSSSDHLQIKPCIHSCIHVYTKCVGLDLNKLNPIWNSYLDLMKKFSWHIEYSINFENSINQLKFQISDAIMYFKANSNAIINNLARKCDLRNNFHINLNVRKRVKRSLNLPKISKRLNKRSNPSQIKMHLFFIDLNRYFYNLNEYWTNLLPNVCKVLSAHHEKCWNGTDLTRYVQI